jgi:rhamnosyltransferase
LQACCASQIKLKKAFMGKEQPKVAAALIIYHPGHNLLRNMASYYPFVDKIYVFDNSEQAASIDWRLYEKIEYHHDGQNRGLPERLNAAAKKAISDGFGWLLTMDQDSYFSEKDITHYLDQFHSFEKKSEVAVFGPVHSEDLPGLKSNREWHEADSLITSGALTSLACHQQVGGFDEALFIDAVDFEYGIRAKLAGFKLVRFTQVFMQHEVGRMVRRSSIKSLFLVKKSKSLHPPMRYYYMLRNYLYIQQKYRGRQLKQVRMIGGVVRSRIVNYLLYGRNSKELLHYVLLAYRHYKENKMGKLS